MLIKIPRGWEMPERDATPESVFLNRRAILAAAGLGAASGVLQAAAETNPFAAPRNAKFTLDRDVTPEWAATGFNNFYEFHPTDKQAVRHNVGKYVTSPWAIEITGLVEKPFTLDLDDLQKKFTLEERLYRFRCVEAWAMAVPWVGFPMAELVKLAKPKPEAKFMRFVTAMKKDQMPGLGMAPWYPWPYFEGLRIDEAANPLALVVTGMYGKVLPKQNGAPVRVIVPWKYGYKNPKAIVKIEFTTAQPSTFWNKTIPAEYGFYSNVNPAKPHPRWSQATEKLLPDMRVVATQRYNGYERFVEGLYDGKEF
ncbi:MAG: protein-methionine-sulfoxide reductase catalytic subunit MsrP [Acidobacteria bacterium]|nr:protein-methionine-sulfoxide reductase catalytic subunit MsrP [Acidobacteriota bacterium]